MMKTPETDAQLDHAGNIALEELCGKLQNPEDIHVVPARICRKIERERNQAIELLDNLINGCQRIEAIRFLDEVRSLKDPKKIILTKSYTNRAGDLFPIDSVLYKIKSGQFTTKDAPPGSPAIGFLDDLDGNFIILK